MPDTGEKTEEPTPQRRQESRDEGNVAKSQDLTAAISLLGAVILLGWLGRDVVISMRTMFQSMLQSRGADEVVMVGDIGPLMSEALHYAGRLILPFAVGLAVLAVLSNVVQIGFLITGKPIVPKFSKLNPLKGLQQIFSKRGLMRLIMSLGKVAIIAAVAIWIILMDLPRLGLLGTLEAASLLAAASYLVYWLAMKIALILLLLALIDYIYQRWQHEQDMKMTKQEVKEEFKKMEGDPLVKQRRMRVARQIAMQRISSAVPGADVIVTNPTHFAVALKYEEDAMGAPKVVAKGADFLAMRIRQLAAAHGVPIVERRELARALYRHVEVGQEIPAEYYAAVAEILAYVYRLSRQAG